MTATEVQLRVTLPHEVATSYEKQAAAADTPVEQLASERLLRAVKWNGSKPIHISDAQRLVLERILGVNISSPQKLVAEVQALAEIEVGEVRIELPVNLLSRIKTRTFGASFEDVLRREILQGLERFTGMR